MLSGGQNENSLSYPLTKVLLLIGVASKVLRGQPYKIIKIVLYKATPRRLEHGVYSLLKRESLT